MIFDTLLPLNTFYSAGVNKTIVWLWQQIIANYVECFDVIHTDRCVSDDTDVLDVVNNEPWYPSMSVIGAEMEEKVKDQSKAVIRFHSDTSNF